MNPIQFTIKWKRNNMTGRNVMLYGNAYSLTEVDW